MPGCGTFSLYDVDSYILFPNFPLHIDNSVDNIVSYKSIRQSETVHLDYAQPRSSRSSSTVFPPPESPTLIKPDPKDNEIPTYHITTPKKAAPPAIPPHPTSFHRILHFHPLHCRSMMNYSILKMVNYLLKKNY